MPRLIDADAYKRVLEGWLSDMQSTEEHAEREAILSCICQLDAMQTADVAPVRHGHWIEDHDYLKCPECSVMVKLDFTFFDIGNWDYCPNCGAKMDGEDGDGNDEAIL